MTAFRCEKATHFDCQLNLLRDFLKCGRKLFAGRERIGKIFIFKIRNGKPCAVFKAFYFKIEVCFEAVYEV